MKTDTVDVCLHYKRAAPAVKITLSLPVYIASLLVVAAPFMGGLKMQNLVRTLVLCFLFVSFAFTASQMNELNFGTFVPKICQSLEQSFALYMCIDRYSCNIRRTPPPSVWYSSGAYSEEEIRFQTASTNSPSSGSAFSC